MKGERVLRIINSTDGFVLSNVSQLASNCLVWQSQSQVETFNSIVTNLHYDLPVVVIKNEYNSLNVILGKKEEKNGWMMIRQKRSNNKIKFIQWWICLETNSATRKKKKLFNYIRMKQNSNRQENQIVFMRIIIIKKRIEFLDGKIQGIIKPKEKQPRRQTTKHLGFYKILLS